MTQAGMNRRYSTLGWTLGIMAVLAVVAGQVADHIERTEQRAERLEQRAERDRVAAERERLRAQPSTQWFEYRSLAPVEPEIAPGDALVMQAHLVIHEPGTYSYQTSLRCRPEGGGPQRLVSARMRGAGFFYPAPRVLGYPPDETFGADYERVDGQWTYDGRLPKTNSDCRVQVRACALLAYEIEKCQRIASDIVRIRRR